MVAVGAQREFLDRDRRLQFGEVAGRPRDVARLEQRYAGGPVSNMLVSTGPGVSTLTLMPSAAISPASAPASARRPPLEAE